MTAPFGVILAGGRGERLGGVRKADLRIGGARLSDRVLRRLGRVQSPVFMSIANGSQAATPPGIQTIPDLAADAGPLAGLVAAVATIRDIAPLSTRIVTVAVDTPFLPEDFVSRLMVAADEAPAAFAAWGDSFYPTNALWRLADIADLPEKVEMGQAPNSPSGLLLELGAIGVDWRDRCAQDPFANLNTLTDLVKLGHRASLS